MNSSIPNTPQDLLNQLEKELDKLWDNLHTAQSDFDYHDKRAKRSKSIINSVTKQIEEKEQYVKSVGGWREG